MDLLTQATIFGESGESHQPLFYIHVLKLRYVIVVSGCFVCGVSPSFRLQPDLAPKRGFLERLKVRA